MSKTDPPRPPSSTTSRHQPWERDAMPPAQTTPVHRGARAGGFPGKYGNRPPATPAWMGSVLRLSRVMRNR